MNGRRLLLGIDGGQSSTTALIGDETGRVLGMGRSGPCNHVEGPLGRDKFIDAIQGSVAQAWEAARLPAGELPFAAACAGFSGGPADKEALFRELVPASRYRITIDAEIALLGATGGSPGIITIAGTGSISYGRDAAGKFVRVGGWGYIFGDEGGGFDIVRQALRAILRLDEGWGPPTTLRDLLLGATGAADANDLMHRFYTQAFPRARIAGLSVLVDQAANNGDEVARQILLNAAQQLATSASTVRAQLFEPETAVPVAYVGGAFRSELLLERFRLLVELESGSHAIAPRYGPAAGALLQAYTIAGLTPVLIGAPEEKV
jgi:N-acetylglucosamine kinase-like BadF-type ATPase